MANGRTIRTMTPAAAILMASMGAAPPSFAADPAPTLGTAPLYHERYRPQFHFTSRIGWLNDPNGLVYDGREFHLFYQHNPQGVRWGNMHWGHAVSPDLVHWRELGDAISPDAMGTIFSGSAVIDTHNTAGFGPGALVCIYTAAGGKSDLSKGQPFTQCLAYSTDGGRTLVKYSGNPVLPHVVGDNRDPKVFWYEPAKRWVMALFLHSDVFALFGSPDLKKWTKLCDVTLPGAAECPDFFELPVGGDAKNTRWVFCAANGRYRLGRFDGRAFTPETDAIDSEFGPNIYAAQTYNDAPDGRRIQIAWMRGGKYPGMPFNQQMSFPRDLTLRTTPAGIRLCELPSKEVALLHGPAMTWKDETLAPAGPNPLASVKGELLDLDAEIEIGAAATVKLHLAGQTIRYDAAKRELECDGKRASMDAPGGVMKLRVLLDRTSLELFGEDGVVTMGFCFAPPDHAGPPVIEARGGDAKIRRMTVWPIRPAWH